MFCPKCGQRNEGNYKFCRGCGENLQTISKAMERRWLKLFYRALDGYIRNKDRKLPDAANNYRRTRWIWLMLIGVYLAFGVFSDSKYWWVMVLMIFITLLAGAWDYVNYKRLSASGSKPNKSSSQPAILPDSAVELHSAPTTNELAIPTTNELASPFSVTESTTRQLEPLTAAKKRSGDLL